jgi:hypothetical protein
VGQSNAPKNSEEPCAQEPFPRLLRGDLDEWCPPKSDSTEVCPNVVCYNHRDGQDEPDEAFQDVVDDEMRLSHDQEQSHVGPGELRELELVVALLQRVDEEDEANNVQHERDEPVVCCQGKQDAVHQQDVLEIVYHALAVQKVHGRPEKVPVQRLCEAEAAGSARHVRNGDDLLEGYNLYRGDDDDNVDVAGAEEREEGSNHDERPNGPRYEVGLLLLVLGLFGRI